MTDQLFDADVYGPATPPRRTVTQQSAVVEPFVEPWKYVRNGRGMLPFAHLIKAQLTHGSVLTACDLKGNWITMDGVTQMVRCPECDLAAQLG